MKKILLAISILALWAVGNNADAATALEFYYDSQFSPFTCSSCAVRTNDPEAVMGSLVIDRTALSGTKDFLVLGSAYINGSTNGEDVYHALMRGAATTTGSTWNGATIGGSSGLPFASMSTTTVGVESVTYNFIAAQENSGLTQISVDYSDILALELPSSYMSAASEEQTCSGAATTEVTKLTLSFTPATTESYLIIGHAGITSEDWDDAGSPFFRMKVNGSNVADNQQGAGTGIEPLMMTTQTYYQTFIKVQTLESTSTQSIALTFEGDGTSDEACMQEARIVAIPVSAFENSYTAEANGQTIVASLEYTNVLQIASTTLAAAKHIAFFSSGVASENGNVGGATQLVVGTTTEQASASLVNMIWEEFDEDFNQWWPVTSSISFTGAGETTSFKLRGKAGSEVSGVSLTENKIYVFEIPTGAAAGGGAVQTPSAGTHVEILGGTDILGGSEIK